MTKGGETVKQVLRRAPRAIVVLVALNATLLLSIIGVTLTTPRAAMAAVGLCDPPNICCCRAQGPIGQFCCSNCAGCNFIGEKQCASENDCGPDPQ